MPTKSIVVFKESASMDDVYALIEQVKEQGGYVSNVYDAIFKGFAAVIEDDHLRSLQSLARVRGSTIDYIESDGVVTTFD